MTSLSTGADGAIWSPDGKNIVFIPRVYPDCQDDACNQQRDEELKKSKVKAKIFKHLLYRHWTEYTDFKRSRLFVVGVEAGVSPATPRDLTSGDHDVPLFSLGCSDMSALSPDGQELAYTCNTDKVGATSTNNDIFLVPLVDGAPKKISTSPGSDSTPRYSPDGKSIAWLSQARGGYESDRFTLAIYDRTSGKIRIAPEAFDRWVGSFTWAHDSQSVSFSAEDHGEAPIYQLPVNARQPNELIRLHADDLVFGPDGKFLYFSRNSIKAPNEIWRLDVSAKNEAVAVTYVNDATLAQVAMQPLEPFQFKASDDVEIQGFLVKPPLSTRARSIR